MPGKFVLAICVKSCIINLYMYVYRFIVHDFYIIGVDENV